MATSSTAQDFCVAAGPKGSLPGWRFRGPSRMRQAAVKSLCENFLFEL